MMKNILVACGLALVPTASFGDNCASGSCAVNNNQVVSQAVVTQQHVVGVVSPQIVTVAPQAVVSQNSYNQQVVGVGVVSQQNVMVPTVTVQAAPVQTVVTQAAPLVVRQYNAGVATFQGTQNYVRQQSVVVQQQPVQQSVVVQQQPLYNQAVVGQNFVQGGGRVGLFGRGGRQSSVTRTKTFTKTRN